MKTSTNTQTTIPGVLACALLSLVAVTGPTLAWADTPINATSTLIESGIHIDQQEAQTPASASAQLQKLKQRAQVKIELIGGKNLEDAKVHYILSAPVRVGYQMAASQIRQNQVIEGTREQLYQAFGRKNVFFHAYRSSELLEALQAGYLDFVIADADFYSQQEITVGLKGLASIWPLRASSPAETVASVYITAIDNNEAAGPEQMNQRSIAAYFPGSFAGFRVAQRDMYQRGLIPEVALKKVVFFGNNPKRIIEAVKERRVEYGILPACVMEHLAIEDGFDMDSVKVLGARHNGLLQCAFSTDLYPGYYFAAANDTESNLVKAVSAVLFTMSAMDDGTEWSLPASNRAVHDLFFDLKIGPYSHLAQWNFQRFIRENSTTFLAMLIVTLLIISYALTVSLIVRRRTQLLQQALADRNRIEKLANASRDHIANLERTGIVGQMSTMIAHELKQPLGAITNFANGLLRRTKRGTLDPKMLTQVLEEIVEQGTRASEIVNRVRAYAKHQTPELKMADMSVSVERAIETFKRSRRTDAAISKLVPPYLWADIDGWEIELAVLNLLKNAADAIEGVPQAEIKVRVRAEDRFWRIEVSDNGPKIRQEQVDQFMQPLVTSKANGLGLGLSIVANIAERHHGRLIGIANEELGVTIALDVPRSEIPEHTAL